MTISSPISPDVFTEFFEMGQQEKVSPFLTPGSRNWGVNLTLKASILAAVLLVATFVLSFFPSLVPLSRLLLLGVYFLAGIPSLIEAIEDLSNGEVNIDILMTLAAFSSVLIGSGMEGGLLLVLFAISGALEDAVTDKAKGALSNLHKLSPTKACVIEADGTLIERALRDINVGTTILVKAGQVIPLDGDVIEGISSVNLVHLTGENLPVTKKVGDAVPAGGRNLEGVLKVHVTRTSADSTLARIIQLVTEAQEARPLLQRWFDRASRAYALTIISLSALFFLTFPFLFSIPFLGIEGSLYRALAFLIAASPCALIIAIPIAYLSAVSACAKNGILIKGGVTLDALSRCRSVAFDKTGTLTTGQLTCSGVEALQDGNSDLDQAVAIAYALEKNAVHPIATALTAYGNARSAKDVPVKNFRSVPGYGLQAQISLPSGPQDVYIGKPIYILDRLPAHQRQLLETRIAEMEQQGELIAVLLAANNVFIFRFQDTLRPDVSEMIQAVKKRGWSTVMLTGDHAYTAQKIAKEVALDKFYADLTPEDKLRHVAELSSKGLAMIGDGVNDAPALARATVGVCMGKVGSTAAVDAADVVLLNDNLEKFDWLIGKAKKTQAIVKQNLTLAVAAIIFASLPALGGIVPLWLAVVMHEGGTVLVGLNALRLLRR